MTLLNVAPLVLRRRGGIAGVLPIIGFAASTAILATVLGGLTAFLGRAAAVPEGLDFSDPRANLPFLLTCAAVATALLVPSAMGLGSAAAKLSLSRRERDLASMRLVGGTSAQIGTIAVLDVVLQALIGSLAGIGLHLAVTPALTGLDFGLAPFTIGELLLPVWGYPVLVLAVALLSAFSAALGLLGVVISPLGVARDSRIVRMSVIRLAVWVLLVIGFGAAFQIVPQLAGTADDPLLVTTVVLAVFMAVLVGSVNLVGPFVVWLAARILAAVAPRPALLVGARRLAADPRAGWRSVSGVTFGLVIAGFLTLLTIFGRSTDPAEAALMTALNTGGYLTLGIAAVLAAVSTGVTQTARVLDQASVYRSQHISGAPIAALQRARMAEIGLPLAIAAIIAGVSAAGLIMPVLGGAAILGPLVQYLLSALVALGLVAVSVLVSAPLVARVARSEA